MKFSTVVLTFLISAFCLFAQEQKEEGDFRDLKWGMTFEEMKDELVPSSNKMIRYKSYEKKEENFEFAGVTAHIISYGFRKGIFEAVNIGIYNKDLETVVKAFTEKYGEPKKVETPVLVNYNWFPERSDIAISYFPTNKSEKSTSIGISKKRKK